MPEALALLQELVEIPGPPGAEQRVAATVKRHFERLGVPAQSDERGNVWASVGPDDLPCHTLVTAHLDEIGLIVSGIEADGALQVRSLGGVYPWKWGERLVCVMASSGDIPGALSFGSVHTDSPASVVQQAREAPLRWDQCTVFTGLSAVDLCARGVRPGTRVALAPSARTLQMLGPFIASYFLDDRADLVVLLQALEGFIANSPPKRVVFAATAAEEVGGEGASYLISRLQPEVCIALEIGPLTPDSAVLLDAQPAVWVTDSFSASQSRDLDIVAEVAGALHLSPHWQAVSRGGSDASCAAHLGLVARHFTLAMPVANSHGYEIMHREAMNILTDLTVALVGRLCGGAS